MHAKQIEYEVMTRQDGRMLMLVDAQPDVGDSDTSGAYIVRSGEDGHLVLARHRFVLPRLAAELPQHASDTVLIVEVEGNDRMSRIYTARIQ